MDGRTKFATYYRDRTVDNQDYANQRYYNPWMGRFNSPDPSGMKATNSANPASWNMYAYVGGDPINRYDPAGLDDCSPGATCVTVSGLAGLLDVDPVITFPADPSDYGGMLGGYFTAGQVQAAAAQVAQVAIQATQYRTRIGANVALLALQNNPDCSALFGGDQLSRDESGIPTPSIVLAAVLNGTGYGNVQYANMAPTSGDPTNGPYSINNATTNPGLPYNNATGTFSSTTITINTSQWAPFNFATASPIDNAVTLLHELGHVYGYLFGPASTPIQDDQTSGAVSRANTDLVRIKCFP